MRLEYRIINSGVVPTLTLYGVARYIEDQIDGLRQNTVLLCKKTLPAGWGRRYGIKGMSYETDAVSYVAIAVGQPYVTYPYHHVYRASVGGMIVQDRMDELVYVLAHEYGHVQQYQRINGFGSTRYYEVEAERYAQSIANSYRLDSNFPLELLLGRNSF